MDEMTRNLLKTLRSKLHELAEVRYTRCVNEIKIENLKTEIHRLELEQGSKPAGVSSAPSEGL
ncbi:hypothetical protein [Actinomadura rubrisoli]|uniref:Uncharacterized protein n=1 Tax=Actinomadura rubrisoli TaxID=2530368 RepID=A0A4R5CFI1_9ACTN|nr:hypothetical protein [Actinomadura rubrisoli]TDD97160.1 hypothetical protein E1298_01620 [Actinomadura rubrisoli]